MKNKKMVYVLFPLVIIIWGLIIYRAFFEEKSADVAFTNTQNITLKQKKEKSKETYSLLLNYKDPFLSKSSKVEKNPKDKFTNSFKRVRWPRIFYKGCIKNKNKYTAVLNINGKSFLADKKFEFEEMRIHRIYNDSIVLIKQKEKITIKKRRY